MRRNRLFALTVFAAALCVFPAQAFPREIKDMAGRTVRLPDSISRVYGSTYITYALAPELLTAIEFPLSEAQKRFMDKRLQKLPVTGSIRGSGMAANQERIMALRPDCIINSSWGTGLVSLEKSVRAFDRLGIPVVNMVIYGIEHHAEEFRFLGKVLNREKRGGELASYADRVLAEIKQTAASIPEGRRLRVYYAEGADGLSTECVNSVHAEIIPFVGAVNVNQCIAKTQHGMDRISMERVLLLDPDAVLVLDKGFYNKIFTDSKWSSLRAVKNRRIYLIPKDPINWFDRPPSFMKLLGVQWAASVLYPEYYKKDMVRTAKEFFKLFLHAEASEKELEEIMNMK